MTIVDDRFDTLIIARRAVGKRPPNEAKLVGDLLRFRPADVAESAWRDRIVARAATLEQTGKDTLVARLGKVTARDWKTLADRILPLVAMGARPDTKLAGRDAWAAAIVARAYGMWTDGAPPKLKPLCDAFAWRAIGLTGKPKALPAEVRAHFLRREVGGDAGSPERQVRTLAAAKVGAARTELRSLTDALVRMWLVGRSLGASPERPFADRVLDVARGLREGVFGDRKAFIGAVFDASPWAMSLADFKTRLLAEHRAGRIMLARADLVSAMDPTLVAQSETLADGASFHFIVRADDKERR